MPGVEGLRKGVGKAGSAKECKVRRRYRKELQERYGIRELGTAGEMHVALAAAAYCAGDIKSAAVQLGNAGRDCEALLRAARARSPVAPRPAAVSIPKLVPEVRR